jgi:hypothetical protein
MKTYNPKLDVFVMSYGDLLKKHKKESEHCIRAWNLLKEKNTVYAESIYSCFLMHNDFVSVLEARIETHKNTLIESGYGRNQVEAAFK